MVLCWEKFQSPIICIIFGSSLPIIPQNQNVYHKLLAENILKFFLPYGSMLHENEKNCWYPGIKKLKNQHTQNNPEIRWIAVFVKKAICLTSSEKTGFTDRWTTDTLPCIFDLWKSCLIPTWTVEYKYYVRVMANQCSGVFLFLFYLIHFQNVMMFLPFSARLREHPNHNIWWKMASVSCIIYCI